MCKQWVNIKKISTEKQTTNVYSELKSTVSEIKWLYKLTSRFEMAEEISELKDISSEIIQLEEQRKGKKKYVKK